MKDEIRNMKKMAWLIISFERPPPFDRLRERRLLST
jgi:hypothetical protein